MKSLLLLLLLLLTDVLFRILSCFRFTVIEGLFFNKKANKPTQKYC
jgi:hypothetical protein